MPASDVFRSLLIHEVDIYRNDKVKDGVKNPRSNYVLHLPGVLCRRMPIKADSLQAVGGMVYDADYKFKFEAPLDIKATDELRMSGGKTYRVSAVPEFSDGEGDHHITAYVKQI